MYLLTYLLSKTQSHGLGQSDRIFHVKLLLLTFFSDPEVGLHVIVHVCILE